MTTLCPSEIRRDLYPLARKHCSKCGCWRLLFDFQRDGERLQSHCKFCQRAYQRRKRGYKTVREPGRCAKGHRLTPENTGWNRNRDGVKRYCRTCRRASTRVNRRSPLAQEYDRIYKEAKRRERGAHARARSTPTYPPRGSNERVLLPADPFVKWLRETISDTPLSEWALSHGLDDSHLSQILRGKRKWVHIDIVDRAVDPATLNELYPVDV